MSMSRQQRRKQEKLAKKAAKKDKKILTDTILEVSENLDNHGDIFLNKTIDNLFANHTKEYIDNKISNFFPRLIKNEFLDIDILFFIGKHNQYGVDNLRDMGIALMQDTYNWIRSNEIIANYLEGTSDSSVKEIVRRLNATTDQEITAKNAKEYLLDLTNRIPEVLRYANKHNLPWSSEKEVEELNKAFAKFKGLEYKLEPSYSEEDIEYFRELYENLSYKFLDTVNVFDKKYRTSDHRLLIDNFYDHPEEWWYNEGKQISEDIADYISAWNFAEEDSTRLKYLVRHSEYQIEIFNLCYKELGINIEEFLDKCEYELKHKIRETIDPYGEVNRVLAEKKYKKEDPNELLHMGVQLIEVDYTKESYREMLLKPKTLSKLIEALKADMLRKQKREGTITFEEIVRNEISSLITSKINRLSNDFYSLKIYKEEDCDKLISEISFEHSVDELVKGLKGSGDYDSYFEYPDFESRLRLAILELSNKAKPIVIEKALKYKKKITDNNAEEILDRVEVYLTNKLNLLRTNRNISFRKDIKDQMLELFGTNFKEIPLIEKYKILFDNARKFLDMIKINQDDKKVITDRIDFLFEHNKKFFENNSESNFEEDFEF